MLRSQVWCLEESLRSTIPVVTFEPSSSVIKAPSQQRRADSEVAAFRVSKRECCSGEDYIVSAGAIKRKQKMG